jgi:sodium/potassium-transporting ATPase subunit alpha
MIYFLTEILNFFFLLLLFSFLLEFQRLVFENLKKVIGYLLPAGSFSEMLPVIANVFLGIPLPLSSFLMIVICMCTDMFGSLALIYEEPEADIMDQRPRNIRTDKLVDSKLLLFAYGFIGMLESAIAFFMFFWFWHRNGVAPHELIFAWQFADDDGYHGHSSSSLNHMLEQAQSVFFVSLVMSQIGNLLSVRTRRLPLFHGGVIHMSRAQGRRLLAAIAAELFWVIVVTEVPQVNQLFKTASVSWEYWLMAMAGGFTIFALGELRKYLVIMFPNGFLARVAW